MSLIARLFYWQVIKRAELSKSAQNQYNSEEIVIGERGNIIAPDGSYWVMGTTTWKIYSNYSKSKMTLSEESNKIAPIIGVDEEKIKATLGEKKNRNLLAKRIDNDIKKNLEALGLPDIFFEQEETRFYPEASAAAQVLGFVGKNENGENLGYFGLEGFYNLPLSGKSGYKGVKNDALGLEILTENSQKISSFDGVNLVTSLDKRVQTLIEQKLKEGIEKYGATGGSITVMDPNNGDILGMTSLPSYDPVNYSNYNNSLFKNPIISDTFEPGSIFKVIVMASALDSGKITPETNCDICEGPLHLDKYTIKTWNNKYQKDIDMTNVIVHSDNIGMVYIGQKLGQDDLYDYLDKFGIGKKTGIDLQGEVSLNLRAKGSWNSVDLATTSFGQGIAVTGIEVLRAVSVVANGGYLVTPRVVTGLEGKDWAEDIKHDKPEKVISKKAAEETAKMMVQAVNQGESKWAKPSGFNNIAGKTGTAQIPVAGHYDPENTNHSFIGFAPFDKPKFIMLITLKSPQSSPWAAETAAPLWFNIGKDLFPYLGVSPN